MKTYLERRAEILVDELGPLSPGADDLARLCFTQGACAVIEAIDAVAKRASSPSEVERAVESLRRQAIAIVEEREAKSRTN